MRHINQAGLDLIKEFESLRLKAYQDERGIWTIGYGHTGPEVTKGLEISADQAEDLLRNDVAEAEAGVDASIKNATSNQFSACVSLTFNIGVAKFKSSTLARYMREGQMGLAADQFPRWVHAGDHVSAGLVRRRKAERKLFLTPDGNDESTADTEPLCPPEAPAAPVETPTQTVETGGGSGTQVVVGTANATDTAQIAAITAVEAHAEEGPTQATTAGPKSLWTTIIGGLSALPAAIWGIFQANAEAIKWALIVAGAIVIIYLIRLIILDVMRNYAAMRPDRHNVK